MHAVVAVVDAGGAHAMPRLKIVLPPPPVPTYPHTHTWQVPLSRHVDEESLAALMRGAEEVFQRLSGGRSRRAIKVGWAVLVFLHRVI
jgi:hypothetical protein